MKQRGFTLVELMIVVGVLATLTSLFVANAQSSVMEARAVACEKNRVLFENMEQKFEHENGRPSLAVQELIDAKYVNRWPCPRRGVITWKVMDPNLPWTHQALVCSIHGEKQRINKWIAPQEAGPGFLLSSSFGGPTAEGWSSTHGKYWQMVDGRYRAGTVSRRRSGQHRSFSGDEGWSDYDLSLTANQIQGNGYGVYFRASDTAGKKVNGYLLEFIPGRKGTIQMREVNNGRNGKVFAKTRTAKGYPWTGVDRDIKVQVRGNTFAAFVDGKQVLQGTNSKYTSGAVGLRTRNKSVTDFDDVKVEQR